MGDNSVLWRLSRNSSASANLLKNLVSSLLFCSLVLKHESRSQEYVWGFQYSLFGSKIHHLGQEKSNSLRGSTKVVNIHYLGQIQNLGQNREVVPVSRHERETVTTSHYDDFALRRRPSISMTFHHDETFLTRSPRHT